MFLQFVVSILASLQRRRSELHQTERIVPTLERV